jgi:hypothetical protein
MSGMSRSTKGGWLPRIRQRRRGLGRQKKFRCRS